MKKQRTTTIITSLRWYGFFVALLFLVVMPRGLGQRGQQATSLRPSYIEPLSNLDNGIWTVTGSFNTARYLHTATLLPNGRVLVAGGLGSGALASSEVYDPANGTWTHTGSLNTAREYSTA